MQKQPEKLYIVTESKAAGGEKSTTCSYIYNGFMRNELKNEEGSQIMIYNPEEEITYMYNPEEEITYMFNEDLKTGMKFSDGEDVEMDQVDLFDTEYEDFEGLISAELTTLNGDEVIYMIAEVDEDGIQVQTCTWISTKYKYPIKTEIYYNGNFAFGSEVLEISNDFKIDNTFFIIPDDIQFVEFDDFLGCFRGSTNVWRYVLLQAGSVRQPILPCCKGKTLTTIH